MVLLMGTGTIGCDSLSVRSLIQVFDHETSSVLSETVFSRQETGKCETNMKQAVMGWPSARSENVRYSSMTLLSGNQSGGDIVVAGYFSAQPNEETAPDFSWITPGLLVTMQIPLLAGRGLQTHKTMMGRKKWAIVDEAFVTQYSEETE